MTTANVATRHTLIDVAKRRDPSGKLARIAEVLNALSPAVQDAPYLKSNSPAGNRVTVRSGLPTVGWIRVNQGVAASKSLTKQIVDSMGIMAGLSEVDVKHKKFVSDFNAYRYNEDQTFLEAMAQAFETTIFTGNEGSNEAAFTGFGPRYATKSTTLGTAGYQIVDAGGTGTDNTSLWIVDWGDRAAHLIHPENSEAGIEHNDRGELKTADADSKSFFAATSEFMLTAGLSIENVRRVVRIANIDKSDLAGAGGSSYSGPNLINLLIEGFHKCLPKGDCSRVIYGARACATALDKLAAVKANLALGMGEWAGEPVSMFRGAPIRETDALGADEARIT